MALFAGAMPIQIFAADDRAARSAAVAMLARIGAASMIEVGQAFGLHRNTVARLSDRLERGGMAAVVPAKPGPKGPHKVTPEVRRLIFENSSLGHEAVRRLVAERTRVQLSAVRILQLRREAQSRQTEFPLAPTEAPAERETRAADAGPAVETAEVVELGEPAAVLPERDRGRYMGATLYYPALQALGLLEAARDCFRLPGSEVFGVRAVTLTLFYLSLFGKTTVEGAKHLPRWEFGPLVGSGRAPAVKTLRRKLAELVKQGQAGRFAELLSRRWVEQGLIATAYLYVDGHMKIYTGKRRLPEVWNSQRRMPLPGMLSYFVNDQQGRPLLFITEEANARLRNAMPRIVAAIREVLGERRFTIIFDRGGYDGKLYDWMRQEKIDFITYQRGTPDLAVSLFTRRECRFEGRRLRMRLAEDEVKVGQSGPWRRIVILTKDGKQTPILTSLGPELGAARIAALIFARWRQENFFRYMREHLGLDQLLGSAYQEADGTRMVANPERRQLDRQIKSLRQDLAALQARLGQATLAGSAEDAQQAQRARELEGQLAGLVHRRRAVPVKVPVGEVEQQHVMRLEQKAIFDRIKITAYNAEEWLLDRLAPHYPERHDIRGLLRSFAELSGEISTRGEQVEVILDPPDTPLHRRALRGLCQDLNQLGVVFPGTDLPVTYAVALHHSELAA